KKTTKRATAAGSAGASGGAVFHAKETKQETAQSLKVASSASSMTAGGNPTLREYLCVWRRATAKELGIASSSVMHDTSLDELCRVRPRSLAELRRVSGFGERKTGLYGRKVLETLERFRNGARAARLPEEEKPKPTEETIRLLAEGRNFEEIAKTRGRLLSSVVSLIVGMMEKRELEFQPSWVDAEKQAQIEEACKRLGLERLKPLKDALPPEISYEEIRLVTAHLRLEQETQSEEPSNAGGKA
ncbi:MAG: helix-turn-helix domain-containing protein, partial [Candidatus Acidiferrum sp.]